MGLNSRLLRATLSGALAGLLFGFDTVVISGAIDALVRLYGLNAQEKGITVAIGLVGTVIGALGAGQVGQKLGSRETLRLTALLYIASALGCGLSSSWLAFMTFRFIGGLGIGSSSVLGPVYITEIAPAKLRGRLVAGFQLNVVFGVMAAYISNYAFRTMHLGALEWRFQVGIAVVPAAIFLALLFGIPRSPRWLVSKNRTAEALATLRLMGDPAPESELADIQAALAQEHVAAHESVFQSKYRYPLFLAITIGAFNQLAGINAILYYLNDIFAAAGFGQISSDQQAIAIGTTNFLFTIVGMALIDKLGRKTLLLIGAAGCACCLAGVAWVFATESHRGDLLWLLVTFIAFFSVSQGAVIWVYIGEVFPTAVRSKGQGVGSASHWLSDTVIALVFPSVVTMMSTATPFVFFSAATVVQFIVVAFFYPETKGQTLEDLQRKLMRT
ncbi:MAG TPA: sugar porter family MFS transporter [Terracidiphilus sp.]|nr:sugar porter family MFS transporter [Terracidiphilus sp.]